jgi:hypothetical protein
MIYINYTRKMGTYVEIQNEDNVYNLKLEMEKSYNAIENNSNSRVTYIG